MNITHLLRLLLVVLLTWANAMSLGAQTPKFFMDDVTAPVNEELAVNVRGNNLTEAVGIQFSLGWDTTALRFERVENVILNGKLDENFNVSQLDSGRIGYLEFDGGAQPLGIQDSSLLFTMVFSAVTTVTTVTEVHFDSIPVMITVTEPPNVSVDPAMEAGRVTLEGSNSLPAITDDPRMTVAPNPLLNYGQVTVDLPYGGSGQLELLDIGGRVLFRQPVSLRPGLNTHEITTTALPAAGTYLLRLTTRREQLHRKIVFQGTR